MEVLIDYYEGAYGPTIRIETQSKEWLLCFYEYVKKMNNLEVSHLNLLDLADNHMNISAFDIYVSAYSYISVSKRIPRTVTWFVTVSQLSNILCMIMTLIKDDASAHQYLTESEDVLIELSYRE